MLQLLSSCNLVITHYFPFLWCNLTVLPLGPFQRTGFNGAAQINAPSKIHCRDAYILHTLTVSLEDSRPERLPSANPKKDHALPDAI